MMQTVNLVQTIIVALCSHHLAILWPSDRDDLSLVMTHLWGGGRGSLRCCYIHFGVSQNLWSATRCLILPCSYDVRDNSLCSQN